MQQRSSAVHHANSRIRLPAAARAVLASRRWMPLALVSTALLAACGGGGGASPVPLPEPTPAPVPTGLLVPAEDDATLVAAVQRALPAGLTSTAAEVDGVAAPVTDGALAGFSTTYRLEEAVDEHDIIKYDGETLVIAPSRSACCYPVEPLAGVAELLPPPQPVSRQIRILGTDPGSAQATPLGSVELDAEDSIEGLYLGEDQLIAISSSAWWGYHGDVFNALVLWSDQEMAVSIYDIANPAAPALGWRIDIEGALVASRRVGNQLLVVGRHFPRIDGLMLYPESEEDYAANQAALEALDVAALLPSVTINGEAQPGLVTAADCWVTDPAHPKAAGGSGSPVLTTVLAIDLDARRVSDVSCYTDRVDGVYVSARSLYLAYSADDGTGESATIVHRFSHGEGLEYLGSGRVPGTLSGRGQADFRMNEWKDVLRLVTTRFTSDRDDAFDHRLYVLEQDGARPELQELARLPNDAAPEPIGKANEDLYGVRFLGDRVYLVTFERIDPLYVVDLSDPADPRILGSLELPGFSDLLHPVTDTLLLGLGDDGEGHVKIELFDVSDAAAPASRAALILAEDAAWSWSEARYDRRAFTYLRGDGVDRFAVPVAGGIETGSGYENLQRLYLLEITGVDDAAQAAISQAGMLEVSEPLYGESRYRSVIDGEAVYFLAGESLWSAFWSRGEPVFGPF